MSGVTVYDWEGAEKFVPTNPGFVQDIEAGKKLDIANQKLQSIRDRLDQTLQVEDKKAIVELQNILARLKETLSVHDSTTYDFISEYFPSVLSAIQQYLTTIDASTKSIDGKVSTLHTDLTGITDLIGDIYTDMQTQNATRKKAIKNVDFSVDNMNVPASGIGFFNVTPPAGERWRITSAYIEFPIATGATSGTNALRVIQGSNNWWEASMIMSAPFGSPSGIRYGMPMDGTTTFQPSDLTAFNNQLRDLHITADQPLCLRFNNGANALNNKKATIILKVEVSYDI